MLKVFIRKRQKLKKTFQKEEFLRANVVLFLNPWAREISDRTRHKLNLTVIISDEFFLILLRNLPDNFFCCYLQRRELSRLHWACSFVARISNLFSLSTYFNNFHGVKTVTVTICFGLFVLITNDLAFAWWSTVSCF